MQRVVFDSDGLSLVGVSVLTYGGTCSVTCAPMSPPGITPGSLVTGLAFEEDGTSTGALWSLDSAGGLQRLGWQTRSCPGPGTLCSIAPFLPSPNHIPGGLAISEAHGLVFYSASVFTGGAPDNWVFAAPLANPCQPTCSLQVGSCNPVFGPVLGPITGLAFHDCYDMLVLTDGINTMTTTFVPARGGFPCSYVAPSCCPPTRARFHGICIEARHPSTAGVSCLSPPCPSCPSMALSAVGDAVIGNGNFQIRLDYAPQNVPVALLFGLGPCTSGAPFACGQIYLPLAPPPVSLPTGFTSSAGPCLGSVSFPVPVPLSVALCFAQFSAQAAVVCTGTPPGLGLTNAVCLSITES
ncbi:MAG: hypothetical protein IPM29_08315 [Planctomycetes bacterium]|nr:hypothetical protein [Planctomycetota bacterium]